MDVKLIILAALLALTACAKTAGEPEVCGSAPKALQAGVVPTIDGYRGTWVHKGEIIPVSHNPDRFDAGYTSTPKVLYDATSGTYRTYYTGGVVVDRPGREMFGLALSSAVDGPYVKYEGAGDRGSLFSLGAPSTYDADRQWGMGTVLQDGITWKMWTMGDSDPSSGHRSRVGYAESYDNGLTWQKYYSAAPTGAVFEDMSGCQANGVDGVLAFSVVKEADGFYAWYYTFSSNAIRLAISPDGVNNWRTLGAVNLPTPVTGLGNVVKDGNVYYMTANTVDFTRIVVLASVDRINWVEYDSLTGANWMGYPFLSKDNDGRWHMLYTAAPVRDDGLSGSISVATLQ